MHAAVPRCASRVVTKIVKEMHVVCWLGKLTMAKKTLSSGKMPREIITWTSSGERARFLRA